MRKERAARTEILRLLKKKGKMTSKEVGDALGMTAMGARQHLTGMERDDLVHSEFVRQKAGRPALYFYLSENADHFFPQEYDVLALNLLESLLESEGKECLQRVLEQRRNKIEEEYRHIAHIDSFHEKLQALLQYRQEKGYMTELEETEEIYRLIEYNCPIQNIVNKFPEFGEEERALLENILDRKVRWTEEDSKGRQAHIFSILKK